jgi:hypothetical protein
MRSDAQQDQLALNGLCSTTERHVEWLNRGQRAEGVLSGRSSSASPEAGDDGVAVEFDLIPEC